jgi:alkanesulfonate monooxygenase
VDRAIAFDFHGEHYSFADFVLDVEPVQKPRPKISFGGSSGAAYEVGAEEADIYALWGEPLAGTAEQITTITQLAEEAGRAAPTFQVASMSLDDEARPSSASELRSRLKIR